MERIIIFSPHPDDETLGCGGTIAKNVKEGNRVFVVFMTDGRYALTEAGIMSYPDPLEMHEIRRLEAFKALGKLGVHTENMFFLDIEDKTLKRHKKEACDIVRKILKDINPSQIYFPQEMEYHVDHVVTNRIVKEAAKSLGCIMERYRYAIAWKHPFNLLMYTFGERAFYHFMSKVLNSQLICIDISNYISLKLDAIKEYKVTLLPLKLNKPFRLSHLSRFTEDKEKFFV
jgi:LmbE family N-acetylglucosaminyl deacetylase